MPSFVPTQNDRQLARNYAQQGPDAVVDLFLTMKALTLETVTQASFSLPLGLLDEAAVVDR